MSKKSMEDLWRREKARLDALPVNSGRLAPFGAMPDLGIALTPREAVLRRKLLAVWNRLPLNSEPLAPITSDPAVESATNLLRRARIGWDARVRGLLLALGKLPH